MASVNKVMLLGRLGQDPELRTTPGGMSVGNFSVATSSWGGGPDQKEERTEWHRIVVFGKTAENCGRYLKKGREVFVEGRIQYRTWDDRDGNKRYTTEIVASMVHFIGGSGDGGAPRDVQRNQPDDVPPDMSEPEMPKDDDFPF